MFESELYVPFKGPLVISLLMKVLSSGVRVSAGRFGCLRRVDSERNSMASLNL